MTSMMLIVFSLVCNRKTANGNSIKDDIKKTINNNPIKDDNKKTINNNSIKDGLLPFLFY